LVSYLQCLLDGMQARELAALLLAARARWTRLLLGAAHSTGAALPVSRYSSTSGSQRWLRRAEGGREKIQLEAHDRVSES
jgi:hypothetical protein